MTFGQLLRRARQAAGVSQRELARLLDVSAPYVSDVERDQRPPFNKERIVIVCRRLGIGQLAITKAKASRKGFFKLPAPSPGHADQVLRTGAILSLAWLDLHPDDFRAIEEIARRGLARVHIDPDLPPKDES